MSKRLSEVECIILKIGDKTLNGDDDEKVEEKYRSYIYYPFDSIDKDDKPEVSSWKQNVLLKLYKKIFFSKLAKGSFVTVNVKLVGIKKK